MILFLIHGILFLVLGFHHGAGGWEVNQSRKALDAGKKQESRRYGREDTERLLSIIVSIGFWKNQNVFEAWLPHASAIPFRGARQ